jgi:lipoprotein-releasing system permease protein
MHQIKADNLRPLSFLGFRFLFGKPAQTQEAAALHHVRHSAFWGAVLGIGISIVPLYIVLFVSNGMIQGITDRYLETKTSHLQLSLPFNLNGETREKIQQDILGLQDVTTASFEVDGIGLAASSSGSISAQIRGMDQSVLKDEGFTKFIQVDDGAMFPERQNEAVLGRYLAKALGVNAGDTVTLITLRSSGGDEAQMLPKLSIFRVAGIVSSGYRELDANWFIVQSETALRLLNPSTAYTFIGIKTMHPYGAELNTVASEIADQMARAGLSGIPGVDVRSWRDIERSLFASFSSTKSILILIMAIAILVASINLASALTTYVMEHRTEIAILRSFGVSPQQTAAIFLVGGAATGTLGCIVGSAVGIFISFYINQILRGVQAAINFVLKLWVPALHPMTLLNPDYYLEHIPIHINWNYIIFILGAGIVVSALVSLVPAIKSSHIAPAELIRHEQ